MPLEIPSAESAAPAASSRSRAGQGLALQLGFGAGKPNAAERMLFTERLALMLETGMPLQQALEALAGQVASPAMREVIRSLHRTVTTGSPFHRALAACPEAFPAVYASLVKAGEEGGFLPEVLERLREMDRRRAELRSTLASAAAYPAFLVALSGAAVLFVLVYVFPRFSELFTLIADELPITTRALLALSEGLRRFWPLLLLAAVACGFLIARLLSGAALRRLLDAWSFRLPVVRELTGQYHLIQFSLVMGLSLENGVPLLDALRSTRDVSASPRFASFLDGLVSRVSEGRGMAGGLQEASFLPLLARQLIATGEETGKLALVLRRSGDFFEQRWRERLTRLTKLVEPALLLAMGVGVGLVVSSLILPIFKLSRAVHGPTAGSRCPAGHRGWACDLKHVRARADEDRGIRPQSVETNSPCPRQSGPTCSCAAHGASPSSSC